jgi:hypothetical protein
MFHVPLERGRHTDEAQGFRRGRAIQHDDVVSAFAAELVDIHHGSQLFHAGQDGQLLGLDVADPGGAQYRGDVGGDLAPVPFDFFLDIDFVDGQPLVDAVRVAGLAVEQFGFEVERVGEAVRRIHAHHQRAVSQPRKLQAGGRGETGLAHASFAAKEKDAHSSIVAGAELRDSSARRRPRRAVL